MSGLGIPESPRWPQGRLWFCNWIDRQVMAVLGGQDRRILFICTAEWRHRPTAPRQPRTASHGAAHREILALPVDVPATGRP